MKLSIQLRNERLCNQHPSLRGEVTSGLKILLSRLSLAVFRPLGLPPSSEGYSMQNNTVSVPSELT